MTPDADAAFIVADLIKDVLISQIRARLYASVYEMGRRRYTSQTTKAYSGQES